LKRTSQDARPPLKRPGLALAAALAFASASAVAAPPGPLIDEATVAKLQTVLCLPRPLALAASWDRELVEQAYADLGAALASRHWPSVQAPELDVLRDARRGQAANTFGEDPYLTGELGIAAVRGLQAPRGGKPQVETVVGHFAGPELPPANSDLGPMPVSPREFREVFAAPFEAVLAQAHPAGVLLSDNEIDGLPSSANPALVRMLRQDWHYTGAVLASPQGLRGLVETFHVAATPAEALALAQRAGIDGAPAGVAAAFDGDTPARSAQRAAREGIVLLKNDGTLPLKPDAKTPVLRLADTSVATLAHVDVPNSPFVLVLSGPLPVPSEALTKLVERASAVLAGFDLGRFGRAALDDALAGRSNPGGKLPVSLARNPGQLPMFYNVKPTAWRGYLFDTTKALFPFGWGLSYTRFELGAPQLAATSVRVGETATVRVALRNRGARAGSEVVQLYLRHATSSTTEPVK